MLHALAVLVSLALPCPQDSKAPAAKELEELARTYLSQDARTPKGRLEQFRALRRIDQGPPLSASEVKSWTAKLLKIGASGAKLERKSGRHFFWTKPEDRGLFILGGEIRNPKGLLIAMHGGGAGSGDAWSAHGPYQSAAKKLDWLMICPEVLKKTEHGWTDSGSEEFVLDLVGAALRTWKIDRNRVYFSGHSMGGYGTWTLGAHHADRVAGLAASAGAPTPIFGPEREVVDIAAGVIPCLRNVPMIVYQSDDDPNVPPEANRAAAKKVSEARATWGGFPFEYWEVEGRAHDLPPGGMQALLAKIGDAERDTRPRKVVWQPALEWKRQFYWLWWSDPSHGATVVAECEPGKNEIVVTCTADPKGLEVLLDSRLVDLEKEVTVRLGDKIVYQGRPLLTLTNLVKTSEWEDPDLLFATSIPLSP
jgi:poly(3-hydroxybutyrate) depolymerase